MSDGSDFAAFVVARWPALVRSLVLLWGEFLDRDSGASLQCVLHLSKSRILRYRCAADQGTRQHHGADTTNTAPRHHSLGFFTSFMPHFGQVPGSLRMISGCMGQV